MLLKPLNHGFYTESRSKQNIYKFFYFIIFKKIHPSRQKVENNDVNLRRPSLRISKDLQSGSCMQLLNLDYLFLPLCKFAEKKFKEIRRLNSNCIYVSWSILTVVSKFNLHYVFGLRFTLVDLLECNILL